MLKTEAITDQTQASALCVDRLTKRYGQTCAVDHIGLDVRQGELFGILTGLIPILLAMFLTDLSGVVWWQLVANSDADLVEFPHVACFLRRIISSELAIHTQKVDSLNRVRRFILGIGGSRWRRTRPAMGDRVGLKTT